MAGTAKPPNRSRRELPPPLPPETRTVGQLVAEAVRFYGNRFWPSLALGAPPAILVVAVAPLVIVVFLCQGVLFFVLRGAGEAAIEVAGFLAGRRRGRPGRGRRRSRA